MKIPPKKKKTFWASRKSDMEEKQMGLSNWHHTENLWMPPMNKNNIPNKTCMNVFKKHLSPSYFAGSVMQSSWSNRNFAWECTNPPPPLFFFPLFPPKFHSLSLPEQANKTEVFKHQLSSIKIHIIIFFN